MVPTISKVGAKDYVHWSVTAHYAKFTLLMFSNYMTGLSFIHSLHKVLFTEQPETYYKWDNWPPESDRK